MGPMRIQTCFSVYLEGEGAFSVCFSHGDENIGQVNRAATEAPPVLVPQAAYVCQEFLNVRIIGRR